MKIYAENISELEKIKFEDEYHDELKGNMMGLKDGMNVKLYADPKEKADKIDDKKSIGLVDTYLEETPIADTLDLLGIVEKEVDH